jgi:hypothetical protein
MSESAAASSVSEVRRIAATSSSEIIDVRPSEQSRKRSPARPLSV